MKNVFALGVVISILASVLCSFGFLLQKLSYLRKGPALLSRRRYCNRLWISGLACLVFASTLDYVALAFVAQSIVAPLGAITLLCNLFFGPLLLDEKVTSESVQATATIILGNLISIAFFSSSESHSVMPSSVIVSRLSELDMIMYSLVFVLLLLDLYRRNTRLSLTIAAGMISATSMMMARMLSLMTRESLLQGSVKYPLFMASGIVAIAFVLFAQLRQMDYCLQRFEATYVVPIAQSSMCMSSIAHGMLFFKEYRGLGSLELALFSIGVAITMRGQIILSQARTLEPANAKATSGDVVELEVQKPCSSPSSRAKCSDDEEGPLLEEIDLGL